MEPVYSLAEAVDRFLPGGVWTVSSLRTEIRKGRLQVERIAGKFGVTESAIEEMRKLCRERQKAHGSTSGNGQAERPSGVLETANAKSAQVAAQATLQALKKNSART